MNVTFSKLKKTGEWGIRIKDCDFDAIKPGGEIEVTRKDGRADTVTIDEIVARFDDAIYCSIKKQKRGRDELDLCSCCGEEPARRGSDFCRNCGG
jgi:hypothetical protein